MPQLFFSISQSILSALNQLHSKEDGFYCRYRDDWGRKMIGVGRSKDLEVGYDVPASIGMKESEIQTPCLMLDLDALERNIVKMRRLTQEMGFHLRAHGKMHKSVQ